MPPQLGSLEVFLVQPPHVPDPSALSWHHWCAPVHAFVGTYDRQL